MNLKTRIRSTAIRYLTSSKYQQHQRLKGRKQRQGDTPVVHYFHQVDDPYSHLAVQKLDVVDAAYKVDFRTHLVSKPAPDYLGSAEHYHRWALKDATDIAPFYGVSTPSPAIAPSPSAIAQANNVLAAHLDKDDFARVALETGNSLWQGSPLNESSADGAQAVANGDALRKQLGHFQGAMFYFEGEWYWGVDRIRSLEMRLTEEGFRKPNAEVCVPMPVPASTFSATQVLLEYFPSLRSPYTAVGHRRVLEMIQRTGVRVEVRPVMPMLMRGVTAPQAKQRYIAMDSAREGREQGRPLGRIVDPFGEPVKRAFALFAGAQALGKEMAFVTAYLQAAWFDGVDITNNAGLKQVAERAGLDWSALREASRVANWQAILAANLDEMLAEDLWGVPSFRVSGGRPDRPSFSCWGQDRIWRVESEIALRATT